MKIAFRTDASLQIGSGHVMRCLTLADSLKAQGATCHFICRAHSGHLMEVIRQRGYWVNSLTEPVTQHTPDHPAHAAWLGSIWQADATDTAAVLVSLQPDWLVVDHYALEQRWESTLKPHYKKLLVIDDLADRAHICDVLLDQNLVESMASRYQGKVPSHCTCLLGPQYALVRPEFNMLRPASLARRSTPSRKRLLVFMGGSDVSNETGKVIAGIQLSNFAWQHIDVVVGQSYPALQSLKDSLLNLPVAKLHVQTPHMAQLMAAADLAVTTGGSVTWEKCALGLPSFVVIDGTNQQPIATMMHERGAQCTLGLASDITAEVYAEQLDKLQAHQLAAMTHSARSICEGTGTLAVSRTIEAQS
jgi:UDP-2,4-diacetamido-2,4,6-trideoxy-beta-L-altropyranose hydrolase